MSLAYNPSASSVSISYTVAAAGDSWFPVTIGTNDSPDFTADNAEATAQAARLSPNGSEVVSNATF